MGDFDDLPSIGDAASPDGEELAKEFYQQIRERQLPFEEGEENGQDPKSLRISNEEARRRNRNALNSRQTVSTKYSGRRQQEQVDNEVSPSAGLFSGRGASVYSIPKNSPRQRVVDNEVSLIMANERIILLQLVGTVMLLVCAIYLGMTGSISANDWSSIPDSLDTTIEGISGLLPLPTDTETSFWL